MSASPDPVLSVNGLVKRYAPDRTALAGIDLTASGGEIVGLLGANGAGKTTLVGVCTTRVRPNAGSVRVAGLDVARRPAEAKRRIGVVTQHSTLDRSLRVAEILYWHCRYFNLSRRSARARTDELLERFQLTDRRSDRIYMLSGGLARRLQVAAAVAHNPQIVFLDEPTTGLDAEARNALWQCIRDLARGRACVLLTTHYLDEADQLSTRLVVLDHGAVIAHGTPAELRDRVGADTLISAQIHRPQARLHAQLAQVPGVSHITTDGDRLQLFARHRDGLIAELSTILLPAGLRDLAISPPSLEQVTTALTTTTTRSRS